jgi:hypothetical protein
MLAACTTLGGCMTQRGIPAAGTVVETRVVTTVDTPVGQNLCGNVFRQGAKARPDQSCESTMRQIRSEDDVLGASS